LKIKLHRDEQVICLLAAIKYQQNGGSTMPNMYDKTKSFAEYIIEISETIGSEWVVAKYFNLAFDPFEHKWKNKADVGNSIEVKWTKYDTGQLIVHEYDRPNDIAVLVTGTSPDYDIKGWIPIAMARRDKYRHSKQPNWWVTQINLQPIENLRKSNYANSAI
jgi:hypothetical protein